MKIRVLVYSGNKYFVNCFSNYIMETGSARFDCRFVSDAAQAAAFLSGQEADIILADESFFRENACPDAAVGLCISNRTRAEEPGGRYELNIYQRGRDILTDMEKLLGIAGGTASTGERKGMKVVIFYSPQGGTGKTTLAYACALLCARKQTSVYLNLEEFGCTEQLYQRAFQVSMEEVLEAIKDGRDAAAVLSNAMAKEEGNVTILPVFRNYRDYADMTADETMVLLEGLRKVNGTGCLFVDVSGGMTEKNRRLLEQCDISFWVFDDSAAGRGKLKRIREDRSIQREAFFGKAYFVVNKCRAREEDASALRLPFSESLQKDKPLDLVLSGNQDFFRGCGKMVSFIDDGN